METSYQYFKRLGCKELPFEQLPKDYAWITGCGGDGWYWNFFLPTPIITPLSDDDNSKAIMCKIKRL